MKLNLSADELLSTTRAVRKRLDFDKPVELSVIKECLEYAVQAPTGSNMQGWQWLVVTDPAKRKGLADLYRQGWAMYTQMAGAANNIESADPDQQARVVDSATYMAENFEKAPAMLIPCLPGRLDGLPNMAATSMYGSILPGAWSFMLAARERGLGTAWTTIHLMFEEQAAQILGIPYAEVTQCALITIGYTKGTDFKPAKRPPIETVMHLDTWGSRPG
jgi:nitroreductase